MQRRHSVRENVRTIIIREHYRLFFFHMNSVCFVCHVSVHMCESVCASVYMCVCLCACVCLCVSCVYLSVSVASVHVCHICILCA